MRYFFHVKNGDNFPDYLGTELSGDAMAYEMAVRSSGEAIRDMGAKFWEGDGWHLLVVDENEREVLTLSFQGQSKGNPF